MPQVLLVFAKVIAVALLAWITLNIFWQVKALVDVGKTCVQDKDANAGDSTKVAASKCSTNFCGFSGQTTTCKGCDPANDTCTCQEKIENFCGCLHASECTTGYCRSGQPGDKFYSKLYNPCKAGEPKCMCSVNPLFPLSLAALAPSH